MTWHPWFAEQRLAWARRPRMRRLRVLLLLLVLLVVLAPIGVAATGLVPAPGAVADASLQAFARSPVAIALLLAMLTATGVRRGVLSLAHELRTGWWSAVPIPPRSIRQALFAFGTGMSLAAMCACAAALIVVATVARRFDLLLTALAVIATGIGGGAALGMVGLPASPRSSPAAIAHRQVAFPLEGVGDRGLPYLFDWQRRAALSRWRQGGNAWLAGALLLALPGGVEPLAALGLLLMVLSLAWLGVVLRAAADVAVESIGLLRATAATRRRILVAALRYPAFAVACALVWALAGACLSGSAAWMAVAWWIALAMLSLPTLRICLPLLRRSP